MRRILVANRGEIARRIFRTARAMGLHTVAVFSEPDANAPFVAEADIAVPLLGATSAETYLDVEQLLAAARLSEADAVHPGYGFLAESPDFAEAVIGAGLTWIGPSPSAIRAMALKVAAKELAEGAGVPLLTGAGYPLLVKASAGGGGKGMRIVEREEDLADAVAAAQREAQASFGDGTVFLERYLPDARHVEVQVFGDTHGQVIHLFERECSIQRRHQKIVEESPSPGLQPAVAERMYAAAVQLAAAIGYVGAGTVEFLVSGTGDAQEFFFLEMNTRLQVEHPVTEMVTGLDLVEWQIRVARGEPLPTTSPTRRGHAIEVRLYAEDPAAGDLPSTGVLECVAFPEGVRVDSGVESGSVVSAFYDPMLAKVIAHGPDRRTAHDILSRALRGARLHGPVTNRDLLVSILESEPFAQGATTTAFLDEFSELRGGAIPGAVVRRHLAAAALRVPPGWRNVPAVPEIHGMSSVGSAGDWWVLLQHGRDGTSVGFLPLEADPYVESPDALSDPWSPAGVTPVVVTPVVVTPVVVTAYGELVCVDDGLWSTQWRALPRFADHDADTPSGGAASPVPGTVVAVEVAPGDRVTAGQTLVIIEAMKMEHRIAAAHDGVIEQVLVTAGQSIDAHAVVAVLAHADGVPADGAAADEAPA